MTGVIIRSSVNVDAGARTRWSTVLHGAWLLVFVVLAPHLLESIPRASLGAILVFTGYKLVDVTTLVALYRRSLADFTVCLITLVGVVFVGLFEGILLGFAAAFVGLSYTLSHFSVRSEAGPGVGEHHLHLLGSATFLRLPQLAAAIEDVPPNRTLHVHVEELDYIDQACLELVSQAQKSRKNVGRSEMVLEWQALADRRDPGFVGSHRAAKLEGDTAALLQVLWRDYKRLHHTPVSAHTDAVASLPAGWIHPSRVRLRLEAETLQDVVAEFARLPGLPGLRRRRSGRCSVRLARGATWCWEGASACPMRPSPLSSARSPSW